MRKKEQEAGEQFDCVVFAAFALCCGFVAFALSSFLLSFFGCWLVGWLTRQQASHTPERVQTSTSTSTHMQRQRWGGGATGSLCSIKAMGVCALPPPRIFTRLHSHHTFVTKGEQVGRQRDGQTNTHTHTRTYTHTHIHTRTHTHTHTYTHAHTRRYS